MKMYSYQARSTKSDFAYRVTVSLLSDYVTSYYFLIIGLVGAFTQLYYWRNMNNSKAKTEQWIMT